VLSVALSEYSGDISGSRNELEVLSLFSRKIKHALPLSTLGSKNANFGTQRNTNDLGGTWRFLVRPTASSVLREVIQMILETEIPPGQEQRQGW
jgi:hypothetical protein